MSNIKNQRMDASDTNSETNSDNSSTLQSTPKANKWKFCVGRGGSCLDLHFFISIPLTIIIFTLLFWEAFLYIVVRLAGRLVEKWTAPTAVRSLIKKATGADDFPSYRRYMEQLDALAGRDAWKLSEVIDPNTSDYDVATIRGKKNELRELRQKGDVDSLVQCLKTCLESQLCNTLNPMMYSMAYSGTKALSGQLQEEIIKSIEYVTGHLHDNTQMVHQDPQLFGCIRRLPKRFGTTGLILGGGGMLGYHHFGLVEQLIRNNMLPKVICGTSCGSAVAAFVCTRSDEEILKRIGDPSAMTAFLTPFVPNNWLVRFYRYIRYGYSMDIDSILKTGESIFGRITFLEAYELTGRVLCISVTRADDVRTSTVLNFENAPNVLIYSAVIASSAFPFLAKPLHLMEKDQHGNVVRSHEYSGRYFQDGSLRSDVPIESIKNRWGVRFVVVSQVNPHAFPFLDLRSHGTPGQPVRGWGSNIVVWRGGFPLAILEVALKEHLRFLLRVLALLDIVPKINGLNISHLAFQDYGGDVNIYPSRFYWPHIYIFNNLSPKLFEWFVHVGRQMTFPRLFLLHGRMGAELALRSLSNEISSALASTRASTGLACRDHYYYTLDCSSQFF